MLTAFQMVYLIEGNFWLRGLWEFLFPWVAKQKKSYLYKDLEEKVRAEFIAPQSSYRQA